MLWPREVEEHACQCKSVMAGEIPSALSLWSCLVWAALHLLTAVKKASFASPGRREPRGCFPVVREAEVTEDASRNCIVKAPSPGVMQLCKTFMVSWFILFTRFLIMVEKTSWKWEQKAVKHKASKGNWALLASWFSVA